MAKQVATNPYDFIKNKITHTEDYLGLVPTNSLQTPSGIQILRDLAIGIVGGIVVGITEKMIDDACKIPNSYSEPIPLTIKCTRKCEPKKNTKKKCDNVEGIGQREGVLYCKKGLIKNTWQFARWTEKEGHDCNAPKCASCCKSKGFTYSSKYNS